MNWVSGKVNVWTRPGWLVSSVPSSFTSTTCRRGWYLWRDCKTTICPGKRKESSFERPPVRTSPRARSAGLGQLEPAAPDWLWDSPPGDWVASTHRPNLWEPRSSGHWGSPNANHQSLPLVLLRRGTKIYSQPTNLKSRSFIFFKMNQYLCLDRWIPERGRAEGKESNLMD